MSTREQVEAEAEELYPLYRIASNGGRAHLRHDTHTAYVRAKTISAEQVEAAMQGYREGWDAEYNGRRLHQSAIESAFRAAGFLIEGEEYE